MPNKILQKACVGLLFLGLVSCGGKTESSVQQDSIAAQKTRMEKKKSYIDSLLQVAQTDLVKTDSALQITIAEHNQLEKKVTSQITSRAEGNRLTELRIRRDSLQIRFDVLCQQIHYLHIKQQK